MTILLTIFLVLVVIFLVPILVYGIFTAVFGLKQPDKLPKFMLGVLIQKVATALGFVVLFYLGREYFADHWLLYSLVWFGMFAITEAGQTLLSDYSRKEAVAGIISEAIYFPLAGFIVTSLLV